MTITKRIWSPQPIEDMENLKATIDNILAEALAELKDPEAYAVRQMFNKIKQPNKTKKYLYNHDTELFDIEEWDKIDD
jgi:hypothetical protein